jgi:hypothetical protein
VPVPEVKITMQVFPDCVAVAVAPVTVETQYPLPIADADEIVRFELRIAREIASNILATFDLNMWLF